MSAPRILVLGAPTPFGLHARLMRRVVDAACARGWRLRVQVPPPDPEALPIADGYLAAAYTAAIGARLRRCAGPVVNLDGAIDLPLPRVGTDPHRLAAIAAEHLLEGGTRSAAFLGTRDRADSRELGTLFLDRMRAAGATPRRLDLAGSWRSLGTSANEEAIGDHRVRRWLADLPRPCALLTWSEDYAFHAAELASGILTVGHDLRLLSAGDAPEMLSAAGISGIARDVDQLARSAVGLLADLLRGRPAPPQPLLVPPLALVARRSSAPPLAADPAIARALEHLRRHLVRPPTLATLCRVARLPERTFRRRFVARVGRSPQEEALRLRREHARALLAAGRSVAEAARRSGFGSADTLRRALRRNSDG